ncbi:hypothetical protein HHK36_007480 [Tetracentron sinense]|uniref:Ribosomal protein S21 n=1 Tax=Tetracentron sinense TaxID=13715 RepID=A0A835DLU2_TETSI|nr:hypothetical protein HHK36_007480 [Tetracentron sinense]
MNSVMARMSSIFRRPSPLSSVYQQLQQWRGIRVRVRNGNLEQALVVMQRKMQSSGIERLIKRQQTRHLKNSEKRVLARKNLERKIRSQDLARKLKSILIKKEPGMDIYPFIYVNLRTRVLILDTSIRMGELDEFGDKGEESNDANLTTSPESDPQVGPIPDKQCLFWKESS